MMEDLCESNGRESNGTKNNPASKLSQEYDQHGKTSPGIKTICPKSF